MGSKCGPTIACIYLYILETKFLIIHSPIFYGRYIDYIFAVFLKLFDTKLLTDNEYFYNLKLALFISSNYFLLFNFMDS